MEIELPPDVLKGLPAPSSDDGLIRVNVGLKVGADGKANLVEINDTPLPTGADDEEAEPAPDNEGGEGEAPPAPDTSEDADMAGYSKSASEQLSGM